MKPSKRDHKKVTRFAIWGALSLGFAGFVSGTVICLYFRLPIPPLFITELGLILGACLGALTVLTGTERRLWPSLAAGLGAVLVSIGFAVEWWQGFVAVACAILFTWTLADAPALEDDSWKTV